MNLHFNDYKNTLIFHTEASFAIIADVSLNVAIFWWI